ncbi:uncharacterized protein SCHCODRAFT_02523015 [Schizophyllum commune H4-8]|nr:uncharacterized protein SCHCODRAFT_02523015 [Schizophyllum commune H4-8]KAI5900762.1 hypothetical protein SCHCODRAFT_02523015 [Schizophyllum commune H4-8]
MFLPKRAAEEDEGSVACKEWLYGLPRGGLAHYIASRENMIYFREDITRMYGNEDFILAPTFKLCKDLFEYMRHAEVIARQDHETPRRPLTSLGSPNGLYRYVLIPRTEAGANLLKEFDLPSQTKEDMCGGFNPVTNFPLSAGCAEFPVVECCVHPFSVCAVINKTLRLNSTTVTAQWRLCVRRVVDHWQSKLIKPPQWFIDTPKVESYDEELTPSEAMSYIPYAPEGLVVPKPDSVLCDAEIPEDDFRKDVARWACRVDPNSRPEEDPPYVLYKLRRSKRLQKEPYDPPSPDLPPPSPVRNGPRAARAARRDLVRQPPPWERSYGRFPTDAFTSNDWAYLNYHVALGASVES